MPDDLGPASEMPVAAETPGTAPAHPAEPEQGLADVAEAPVSPDPAAIVIPASPAIPAAPVALATTAEEAAPELAQEPAAEPAPAATATLDPEPEPELDEEPEAPPAPAATPREAAPAGTAAAMATTAPVATGAVDPPEARPNRKKWYVVKVQSGREELIKEAIERRVRKDGLEEYFGQIIIPVEKITEVRTDKNNRRVTKTKERKLYPGYIMAEVEYNDRILYLFRETSGVGDFVGASAADRDKPPPPMSEREIQRMLGIGAGQQDQTGPNKPPPKPRGLDVGDRVRVTDGTFLGMEGEVKEILEAAGHVKVELTIFGRPVPVELEYYQVEQA